MPANTSSPTFFNLFPAEEITGIIKNLLSCLSGLTREKPGEKENDLTKRLYLDLCRFPEYRVGPLSPILEPPIVVIDEDEPEITGRSDIIFTCGKGLETYFPVEAKRLFVTYPSGKPAALVKDYVDDGMMRYVNGQYASKMTEGAMLGYVLDSTVPTAKNSLKVEVDKQAGILQLSKGGGWKVSPLAVSPTVDETCHQLNDRNFIIYHIISAV